MDESSHAVLTQGTELGPYIIEAPLGAGGMGEVYRARDKRLRRTVALKVLPAHLARTSALRQRLEREAEAISSLNHPHICTLHDIGRQGDIDYLVMEFLEGETLAQRLKRGALALPELLEFAIQIAGALDAAHAKGVVHRDIKPANIFIVGRGQVKVLDFGLAKLNQAAGGPEAETVSISADLTSAGTIMGTVAYMSPEQARGEQVDARTDLFSFGVVLYEMGTGTAPFRRNSITLVLDAILHGEPVPLRQLNADLPAALEQIVNTALEKDRELRVQTAAEIRASLMRLKRDAQSRGNAAGASPASASSGAGSTRRTAVGLLAGVAAGAAGMGVFGIRRRRAGGVPSRLTRFVIPLPEGFVAEVSANKRVAISPDGLQIAYNISAMGAGGNPTSQKFLLRSLNQLEPKVITAASGAPFFSPDGQWLGGVGSGPGGVLQLRKVSPGGGAPVTLCAVEVYVGATWADDDTIYFIGARPGPVMRIPGAGEAAGGC